VEGRRVFATNQKTGAGLGARTILVVEDEALVREIIASELAESGYLVLEAATAEEGLATLESQPVHLLFTDIRLPGHMDGWVLAEEARALLPRLPVIYATGYSSGAPRVVPDGVFLRKPYFPSTVIAAVERLLRDEPG
jgi:CheY-like chemotaxis protein